MQLSTADSQFSAVADELGVAYKPPAPVAVAVNLGCVGTACFSLRLAAYFKSSFLRAMPDAAEIAVSERQVK